MRDGLQGVKGEGEDGSDDLGAEFEEAWDCCYVSSSSSSELFS